jgi:hypothetical protein
MEKRRVTTRRMRNGVLGGRGLGVFCAYVFCTFFFAGVALFILHCRTHYSLPSFFLNYFLLVYLFGFAGRL